MGRRATENGGDNADGMRLVTWWHGMVEGRAEEKKKVRRKMELPVVQWAYNIRPDLKKG